VKRSRLYLAAVLAALVVAVPVAYGITFGQPDGNTHPYVGALAIEWNSEMIQICSGTLVAPQVFLTAAHCVAWLPEFGFSEDDVFVTFDPAFTPASTFHGGTYHAHPGFSDFQGKGGRAEPHDIAVIVLDAAPGITPARLPTRNLLDTLNERAGLRRETFTAVGYGTVREDKTRGFQPIFWDGLRRHSVQSALALNRTWLTLSMNPSTGNGGTCYGDSGGPHFLGPPGSDMVVSLTVTGDAPCRATDVTYRVDTDSARAFLGQFVALP
jgi:secreted trypsin-like serine protease